MSLQEKQSSVKNLFKEVLEKETRSDVIKILKASRSIIETSEDEKLLDGMQDILVNWLDEVESDENDYYDSNC